MVFRSVLFAFSVVVACGDSAADEWKQSLSAQERENLESGIVKLQKKSQKEQDTASEDGPEAQTFFKEEYERKIANLVKKYKKMAEKDTVSEKASAESQTADPSV